MVIELCIKGLNGERDIDMVFNRNINLLTGDNGCGKTTILKMLWYLISPNIERIFGEIQFDTARFESDRYVIELSGKEMRAEYTSADGENIIIEASERAKSAKSLSVVRSPFPSRFARDLEDINDAIKKHQDASLFFPTYRRIEERKDVGHGEFRKLDSVLDSLVSSISVDNHRLIASLSTQDIKNLITERYADCSERALKSKEVLLNEIVKDVEGIQDSGRVDSGQAVTTLHQILDRINRSNEEQSKLFQSFDSMQEILASFISDKTVEINTTLSLGEMDKAVSSDRLSSGEKQLLSFLAYNAFYSNIPILIDEPELSLHPDWQRMLVPALESQGSNNQLIMATHSPFIYSKYPEAEIRIGDR